MLETEFFPTPKNVIERMVKPFCRETRQYNYNGYKFLSSCKTPIVDPEAGAGDILDYLCEELKVAKRDVMAIEINSDLRYTLQGKGYRVVGTDILEYDEPVTFGTVFMNPPFSEGVKHVLKVWDLVCDGGTLTALLNAESLRNPCHKEREVLLNHLAGQIGRVYVPGDDLDILFAALAEAGNIEWLGSAFKDAERPTNADVVMIRLKKPESETPPDFEGLGFDKDETLNSEAFSENPLAHRDAIKDLVARYNATRKILIQREEFQSKLNFYLQGISDPVYESVKREAGDSLEQELSLNDQLLVLKSRFWNTVFTKTKLGSKTTSSFQEKFSEFSRTQAAMSFTENNIKEVLMMFLVNREQIMKDCLVEVFDKATAYHEKNMVHTEGWKTNKSWKLNKRIIMPSAVQWDDFSGLRLSYYGNIREFLNDMDKCLCWLSGVEYGTYDTTYSVIDNFLRISGKTSGYKEQFESPFFLLRCFKKGTLHMDFRDLDLLAKFNRTAAEGKSWIGGGY
jgi:Domain of unknown function (DUF4942)